MFCRITHLDKHSTVDRVIWSITGRSSRSDDIHRYRPERTVLKKKEKVPRLRVAEIAQPTGKLLWLIGRYASQTWSKLKVTNLSCMSPILYLAASYKTHLYHDIPPTPVLHPYRTCEYISSAWRILFTVKHSHPSLTVTFTNHCPNSVQPFGAAHSAPAEWWTVDIIWMLVFWFHFNLLVSLPNPVHPQPTSISGGGSETLTINHQVSTVSWRIKKLEM